MSAGFFLPLSKLKCTLKKKNKWLTALFEQFW
jgi:hypothetical protein